MVIGVARFAVQHLGEVDGVPVQSWVYPQDRGKGFSDFALATNVVRVLSQRIGPFPYDKLANVRTEVALCPLSVCMGLLCHRILDTP